MNTVIQDPEILMQCSVEGRKDTFCDCNKNLELVQKGLKEYLEKKCSYFCRFYFLSNDDLLEILSQTKEIRKVKAHLSKVFEGVADLDFKPDDTMHGVISPQRE
jgi:dynein heavy chain